MMDAAPMAADGADGISITPVDRLKLRLAQHSWPFASERRHEIDTFFAERQKQRAGMWNGRILLMHEFAVVSGMLRGAFFETDFAAFHAWYSWDFPDHAVKNVFAVGALCSVDGAFVLGEMGPHTAQAGHIYFPCGTPDPSDVDGERVDLDGSLRRELAEEIGITESDYAPDRGWVAVDTGPRIALTKVLRAYQDADTLSRRIADHLARDAEPELARVHMVRSPADFDPRMATFTTAFLSHVWRG